MSPNLRREIKEIKVGANDAIVKFKNGSTIEAVASGESARGQQEIEKVAVLNRNI